MKKGNKNKELPNPDIQFVDFQKRYNFFTRLIGYEQSRERIDRQVFFAEAALETLKNARDVSGNYLVPETRKLLEIFSRFKQYNQIMNGYEFLIDTLLNTTPELPPYGWAAQLCLNWYTNIIGITDAKIEIPLKRAFDIVCVAGTAIPDEIRDNIIRKYTLRLHQINGAEELIRIDEFIETQLKQ